MEEAPGKRAHFSRAMKLITSLFACTVIALLPACSHGPEPFMLGPWWGKPSLSHSSDELAQHVRYSPASPEFREKLHEACRSCVAVEFSLAGLHGGQSYRVKRAELEQALTILRNMETWYRRDVEPGYDVGLGSRPTLRFLDAEGKPLFTVAYYPACEGFLSDGVRYLSLWQFFDTWLNPADLADAYTKGSFTAVNRAVLEAPVASKPLTTYQALPSEKAAALRHALTHCARVELKSQALPARAFPHEDVQSNLQMLAQVPQWYEPTPRPYPVRSDSVPRVRMTDAEGQVLYEGSAELYHPEPFGTHRSFSSYLPFPSAADKLPPVVGP